MTPMAVARCMLARLVFVIFGLAALNSKAVADIGQTVRAIAPSALVLVVDEQGRELVAQNADDPFVPASVNKVVTAWAALKILGPDYRFKTQFFCDDNRVLYVRGGGDPFMVSEELALLAPKLLEATGRQAFTGMVLDTSYFPDSLIIPGIEHTDEAYDALNAALAVNFNTINAVRRGKTVRSGEKQTPITPLAIAQFKARGPKRGRGRISLTQEKPGVGVRYAGELLAAFIERGGGKVDGEIVPGVVPDGLEPVYVHDQSRPLSQIVSQMLIGSNNFIANQLFLEIGGHELGSPVSLDKSRRVVRDALHGLGLREVIHIEEGSGISRNNRLTARGLAGLLDDFAPNAKLMRRTKRGSRYKTGTLDGVRTLAGFADTVHHGRVRFVISLTGNTGKTRWRILRAIERGL